MDAADEMGDSVDAAGVYGLGSAVTGSNYGVFGVSNSTAGLGVYGWGYATSGNNVGVYGKSESSSGWGVYGWANASSGYTTGVQGVSDSTNGLGVYGYASATNGTTFGVWGSVASTDGFAGYFDGYVQIDGDTYIGGTLSKAAGSFKIDHPLDPDGKYLYHSFVESPDMKNIYDGVVTLDDNGAARVELPDWFEALNKDFRYQLTPIGAAMPDLHIAQEIQDNAFRIAGGEPGMKVAWQVTGIRHDPYAEDNRIPVEEAKTGDEAGTYLYPEGYGQPESAGLDSAMDGRLLVPDTGSAQSHIH